MEQNQSNEDLKRSRQQTSMATSLNSYTVLFGRHCPHGYKPLQMGLFLTEMCCEYDRPSRLRRLTIKTTQITISLAMFLQISF
jgi:hypothetical protein